MHNIFKSKALRNKEFLFHSRLLLFKVNNVLVTVSIDLELKTSGHHQIQFIFNQSGICQTKDNLMWMTDLPSKSLNLNLLFDFYLKKYLRSKFLRIWFWTVQVKCLKIIMLLRNNCRVKIITSQHVPCATQLKTEIDYEKYVCIGNITYH